MILFALLFGIPFFFSTAKICVAGLIFFIYLLFLVCLKKSNRKFAIKIEKMLIFIKYIWKRKCRFDLMLLSACKVEEFKQKQKLVLCFHVHFELVVVFFFYCPILSCSLLILCTLWNYLCFSTSFSNNELFFVYSPPKSWETIVFLVYMERQC